MALEAEETGSAVKWSRRTAVSVSRNRPEAWRRIEAARSQEVESRSQ